MELLEQRLLLSASPTLTITEVITAGTDFNNQPIAIASDLGSATDPVTVPGRYTVTFEMQDSGLATGQNVAQIVLSPTQLAAFGTSLTGAAYASCPSGIFSTDGPSATPTALFTSAGLNGSDIVSFAAAAAAFCEPGQAVTSPCQASSAVAPDPNNPSVTFINGASTQIVNIAVATLTWDGTGHAIFNAEAGVPGCADQAALATWDSNAPTYDQYGALTGATGTLDQWTNDHYAFSSNTLDFGAPPANPIPVFTYEPVFLGAYDANDNPIPNFDITATHAPGTYYLDIGFIIHADGLAAGQEIGTTYVDINAGALQDANGIGGANYDAVPYGSYELAFPVPQELGTAVVFDPTSSGGAALAYANAGQTGSAYDPFLMGEDFLQWDGVTPATITMTAMDSGTPGVTTNGIWSDISITTIHGACSAHGTNTPLTTGVDDFTIISPALLIGAPTPATAAPEAATISGPSAMTTGSPATFTASITGPVFNSIDTYAWSVTNGDDPSFALPSGTITTGSTFTFTPSEDGDYTIALTVTDPNENETQATYAAVAQGTNAPADDPAVPQGPVISGPASGIVGVPLTFMGTAIDPATGCEPAFTWSVTGDGQPFALPDGTVTDMDAFTFTPTDADSYTVNLAVTNADSTQATASPCAVQVADDGGTSSPDSSPATVKQAPGIDIPYYVTTLATIGSSPDVGGLIADSSGDLYGLEGIGPRGGGAVYECSPGGTITVLFAFDDYNGDGNGFNPDCLIMADNATNAVVLYGATESGGTGGSSEQDDCGTVFKLAYAPGASQNGAAPNWELTPLANFTNDSNGQDPISLAYSGGGAIYGTTLGWQNGGGSTVFQLGGGTHGATTLCNFGDGAQPFYSNIIVRGDKIYGTTTSTQAAGGTFFRVDPRTPTGQNDPDQYTHQITTLHTFRSGDATGYNPGALAVDAQGSFYGTTYWGGTFANGTLFEFAGVTSASISATPAVLQALPAATNGHAWAWHCDNAPTLDSAGNVYVGTQGGEILEFDKVQYRPMVLANVLPGTDPFGTLVRSASGAIYCQTNTSIAVLTLDVGDINCDGLVDVADYDIWAANVGRTNATWQQGDLNGDGLVDVADYDIWAANVGTTYPQ
jgi:hypothetical protein